VNDDAYHLHRSEMSGFASLCTNLRQPWLRLLVTSCRA
jgi:hypothetical protein